MRTDFCVRSQKMICHWGKQSTRFDHIVISSAIEESSSKQSGSDATKSKFSVSLRLRECGRANKRENVYH